MKTPLPHLNPLSQIMNDTCTEPEFLKDVEQHKLTILRDDENHRHLRFRKPGTNNQYFDLITWPGYLCFTGDMGTYVFKRLPDMFEFFRTDQEWLNKKGLTLGINPSYWGQKLEAIDKIDGFKIWSQSKFEQRLKECFDSWADDRFPSKDDAEEIWRNTVQPLFQHLAYDDKSGAYEAVTSCEINGDQPFVDFWEYDTDVFSYRFMWCCYAIAWGISTYDKLKSDANSVI